MLGLSVIRGFADELAKIAAISSPTIKAPPAPGGLMGQMNSVPQAPVPTPKIVGKALDSTNLQKTNYTAVNTRVQNPNITLTSEQKALQPPVVRS